MSDHKPTFTVSPAQRPLTQRLTPLAWVVLGVLALVLLLGCIGGAMALAGRNPDEPWEPTPTSSPVPTDTPMPTEGPTATPTLWYTPTVATEPTQAVTETAQFPAWWSDEMTQDEDGNWWPPEEVTAMVEEHYYAALDAHSEAFPEGGMPDFDALETVYYDWYSGPQLEMQILGLEAKRQGERLSWQSDYESLYIQVQDWSEDGMECTLGVTLQGLVSRGYDLNGQLIETRETDSKLILWRMRYDPSDGHWKTHDLEDIY